MTPYHVLAERLREAEQRAEQAERPAVDLARQLERESAKWLEDYRKATAFADEQARQIERLRDEAQHWAEKAGKWQERAGKAETERDAVIAQRDAYHRQWREEVEARAAVERHHRQRIHAAEAALERVRALHEHKHYDQWMKETTDQAAARLSWCDVCGNTERGQLWCATIRALSAPADASGEG